MGEKDKAGSHNQILTLRVTKPHMTSAETAASEDNSQFRPQQNLLLEYQAQILVSSHEHTLEQNPLITDAISA